MIIAKRPANLKVITDVLDGWTAEVPGLAKEIVRLYLDQIALLTRKFGDLTRRLRETTEVNEEMWRLCIVPDVGPVTAGAVIPPFLTLSDSHNSGCYSRAVFDFVIAPDTA